MSAKIKKGTGTAARHSQKPRGVSRHSFEKVYWPYIPLFLLIGALVSLGLKSGAVTNSLKHPGGEVLAYSTSMETQKLLNDTNLQREQNHDGSLVLNSSLTAAAQAKAADMASRNYWSHTTPEGSPPWVFFNAKGYQYQKAGENLAAGFDSEQAVVNAWMSSQGHRHNLLDPAFSDVGFGVANIANYSAAGGGAMTIVVAFYGTPRGSSDTPVVLQSSDGSSAYTTSNGSLGESGLSQKTSRAQVALASFHVYSLATVGVLAVMFMALGLWIGRHAMVVHRAVVKSQGFLFSHPLVDVGLLITAALAFLLSQTAGLIR